MKKIPAPFQPESEIGENSGEILIFSNEGKLMRGNNCPEDFKSRLFKGKFLRCVHEVLGGRF